MLNSALSRTASLGDILDTASLTTSFPTTQTGKQLQQVARLVNVRSTLETERATYYVRLGGFDTHSEMLNTLDEKMDEIDNALAAFVAEMKLEGVWDNTVVLSMSEFARTLSSNGLGTDHGWGGNMFVLGGGLAGGKILG